VIASETEKGRERKGKRKGGKREETRCGKKRSTGISVKSMRKT
jgi:hypothetical protein